MNSTQNIAQIFLEIAQKFPDRPALWCRGQILTYKDLRELSTAMALILIREAGLKPGDRVAILSEKTHTAFIGILATLLAGGTYVPLNTRFPPSRNSLMLERSGATALICDELHKPLITEITNGLTVKPILLFPEADAKKNVPSTDSKTDLFFKNILNFSDESFAYLLFTSGSTGTPKGVPISHANVLSYVNSATSLCRVTENDRLIQIVDLTFDLSVHDMFVTWLNGASLYVVPEMSTLMATRFVQENEITGWLSVPSTAALLKQLGDLSPESLPSLRFTLFCGEALTKEVAEVWAAAASNGILFNFYGPTEATVAFSAYQCVPGTTDMPAVVPLGRPFPGQTIGLFNPDESACREGEIGEICLSGTQVTQGYWKDEDLNKRKFFNFNEKKWYRTGDLGEFKDKWGYIYRGRIDHQVKIRGYRVELQEIEVVVRKASGKDFVAVIPWPLTIEGHATGCVAFIVKDKNDEKFKHSEEIKQICTQLLPDYMVPSRILFISDMPLNSNGKIDYTHLRSHPALLEKAL